DNTGPFIVCDGLVGPEHERLWFPQRQVVPGKFRYVVCDVVDEERELRLMEVALPDDRDWSQDMQLVLGTLEERRVKAVGPAPEFTHYRPLFSPDGERLAGIGWRGRRQFVRCDNREGKTYDAVDEITFSPDGKHLVYSAHDAGKHFLVLDGVEQPAWTYVRYPVFSPDSRHLAFVAARGGKWEYGHLEGAKYFVIRDGKQVGGACDEIRKPVFSPDGEHLVTFAREEGNWHVYLDGEKKFADADGGLLVFTPDGRDLKLLPPERIGPGAPSFELAVGDRRIDLYEGTVIGPDAWALTGIPRLGFSSPDGKRQARIAPASNDRPAWDSPSVLVCDGKTGKPYAHIVNVLFSPDNKHVVYVAEIKDLAFVMVRDGVEGRQYQGIHRPVFSPDSRHLAYVTGYSGGMSVVCDGREGQRYDEVGEVFFSSDSKHMAYRVEHSSNQFLVIDGMTGPSHRNVWLPERWDKVPGKVRYLVSDGDMDPESRTWLVEVDWPKDTDWSTGLKTP
ncbi:MAG TPA: hypothetical protein VMX57_00730, partial [Planctomycetota bacterium]|nr:hypothetical protein [Planctomycetota bacterium]